MKTTRCSRLPGSGSSGSATPFGMTSKGPPMYFSDACPRMLRDGDAVVDPGIRTPQKTPPMRYQRPPEQCAVTTIGHGEA